MNKSSELWIWIAGLIYITLIPPSEISFCLFKMAGFSWCPGCGLGHAVYHLVRGHWMESWNYHPFALPALTILIYRIYQLSFNQLKKTSSL